MREDFPLQAAVLSEDALGSYIISNYFSINASLHCRLFWRSIHDVYRIISGNDVYFYKVYKQGFRRREEIQSEIDILNHLKMSGIKTVYPIPQKDGSYIGQFKTVLGDRYGVLYASSGRRAWDEVEETPRLNENLGGYVASIHKALDEWNGDSDRWELNTKLFVDDSVAEMERFSEIHHFDIGFLKDVAAKIKRKINTLSVDKPAYGLCHGDMYGGNIRVNEDNDPVLYDFDFCGMGWRTYDISVYAYQFGLGCDPNKFEKREKRKASFLEGYNKIRPMSAGEINSLPVFVPFRRIFNLGILYIYLMHNAWGDCYTIGNIGADIINLKKWVELNPVI